MRLALLTLEQWFWHVWDHLWRLVLWNLALFLVTFPIAVLVGTLLSTESGPVGLALLWLALTLVWAPLFTVTVGWVFPMARERSPGLVALGSALRHLTARALTLSALFSGVAAVLLFNAWFYLGPERQALLGRPVALALGGTMLWATAGITLLWALASAALATGESEGRERVGVREALRAAGQQILLYPGPCLFHATVIAAATWAMAPNWFGLAFLWPTWLAVYVATAHQELLFESEAREAAATAAPAARQTSWREVPADPAPDPRRDRPRRHLREIFRPWEG